MANQTDELLRRRRELAHRRRRLVFNNDGDDHSGAGAGTAEGLLQARTTPLLGSHVDAIWYYSTFGMKLHHSDGPFGRLYSCPDPEGVATANYASLMAREGRDALEVMVEACHRNGLEIFYSNRMNDCHDAFNPGILYHLRSQHPEWLLGTPEEGARHEYPEFRSLWTAWNFEVDEIRQLTVEALRQVSQTYDIDGIELDFWRILCNFPESYRHEPVSARNLDRMTRMVRQIRAAVDEEALKRGRPILLAGRCVEDVEISRNSGLDVEAWLEEGLVDMLSVAYGTDHTPPLEPLIERAHRHDTPVYPMCNAGQKAAGRARHDPDQAAAPVSPFGNPPAWRGDALCHFAQGADGLQMFNMFDPELPQWRELGEPEGLLVLDRTYVWDYLPSQRQSSSVHADLRNTCSRWPVTVTERGSEAMPLYVAEDLSSSQAGGRARELTLRVHVDGLPPDNALVLTVNGQTLPALQAGEPETASGEGWVQQSAPAALSPPGDSVGVWLHCSPEDALFRRGENLIRAELESPPTAAARIDEVRLDVWAGR